MAQLTGKKCEGNWDIGDEGWDERHKEQFAALQVIASQVDPDKSLVGAIVSFPWADGAAYYRVASDKPLKLDHIPVLDAWEVPYAHIRGLRRIDVIHEVNAERKIALLTAKTHLIT